MIRPVDELSSYRIALDRPNGQAHIVRAKNYIQHEGWVRFYDGSVLVASYKCECVESIRLLEEQYFPDKTK